MRIIYVCHTKAAAKLLNKYKDAPAKEIRRIRIVNYEPLTFEMVPRVPASIEKGFHRDPESVIGYMQQKIYGSLKREGLSQKDISIEVHA